MSKGVGVIQYANAEGGSGFITNPALPWLSKYNVTQLAPVWDQDIGWLRNNSKPGAFTYYPWFDEGTALPVETSGGCGMGDLVLTRDDVVAPMPSITDTARADCKQVGDAPPPVAESVATTVAAVGSWMEDNPWLAALLALTAAALLFSNGDSGGRKK
jgi:hypothetical protein